MEPQFITENDHDIIRDEKYLVKQLINFSIDKVQLLQKLEKYRQACVENQSHDPKIISRLLIHRVLGINYRTIKLLVSKEYIRAVKYSNDTVFTIHELRTFLEAL